MPSQRALLDQLIADLGENPIDRARLTRPPDLYHGPPGPRWLVFDIHADDTFTYTKGQWHALLVAGLIEKLSRDMRFPRVAGLTVRKVIANDQRKADFSSLLPEAYNPAFRAASMATLRTLLEASATAHDLGLKDVRFLRLRGRLAIDVVVTASSTEDESTLARSVHEFMRPAIDPDPAARAEGAWVLVERDDGTELAGYGYSVRTLTSIRARNREALGITDS
jgi:hypothetical protein